MERRPRPRLVLVRGGLPRDASPPEDAPPPTLRVVRSEAADAVQADLERAIATLPDGERAAIAACYYADLTHEEAAVVLGIPLGTVKTHILRAKARLRALLCEESP